MPNVKENITKRKICGIYRITSPSGRIYIGQSIDILRRWWYDHIGKKKGKGQPKLVRSFTKYGPHMHRFEFVEECDRSILDDREEYWGLFYDVLKIGLNCSLRNTRQIVSEETRAKLRKANLGKKCSEETKQKLREINTGKTGFWKGKSRSQEVKDKIREKLKGKPLSKEHIEKRSKSQTGKKRKPVSEKTKEKLRLFNTGKYRKPVIQYSLDLKLIIEWKGYAEVKKFLGLEISHALTGKMKTCGGFIWKYKNEKDNADKKIRIENI